MDGQQIQRLVGHTASSKGEVEVRLVETHANWIILTRHYAYKIKKPVHFSFMDYSTLEKRKYYCEKEVALNRRLAPDMYLGVAPVRRGGGGVTLDDDEGEIIDYAVKMRRMDDNRQMDLLLQRGEVSKRHMEQLAETLAGFHAKAEVVRTPPDLANMQQDFADLLQIKDFIASELGPSAAEQLENIIALSARFLSTHADRILDRHRRGITLDGHGDLHSRNIFLLDEPVIFDCIEFSDHLRRVDVLNELAFLCMDLDYYDSGHLATIFLDHYLPRYPCLFDAVDQQLFQYYKCYRANVRLKITSLQAIQKAGAEREKRKVEVKKYFALMEGYGSQI